MASITFKYAGRLLTLRSAHRIATEFLLSTVEQQRPTIQDTLFPFSGLPQAS